MKHIMQLFVVDVSLHMIGPDRANTNRQHTATYWINNWTKQTSGDVVAALSTKDDPLMMVKQ
jgi:hypothetical protein